MAKREKIKEIRDNQRNHARMEISKISSNLPGDTDASSKFDADIKLKIKSEVTYGRGLKITQEQKGNRISQISEMILRAYSERECVNYITHQWDLSEHQAKELFKESKKSISEPWRANFETEVDWHVAIRKRIIKKNLADGGDDKMALLAADSLAKVQGVFDVKPILEPEDSIFEAADVGLEEHEDVINAIQEGDESKLEQFKKQYKENDRRSIDFEDEDESQED